MFWFYFKFSNAMSKWWIGCCLHLYNYCLWCNQREYTTKEKSNRDPESPGLTAVSSVQGSPEPSTVTDQVSEHNHQIASQDDRQMQIALSGQITIPDIHNIQCDRSANNSSSDFTQCDDPRWRNNNFLNWIKLFNKALMMSFLQHFHNFQKVNMIYSQSYAAFQITFE